MTMQASTLVLVVTGDGDEAPTWEDVIESGDSEFCREVANARVVVSTPKNGDGWMLLKDNIGSSRLRDALGMLLSSRSPGRRVER